MKKAICIAGAASAQHMWPKPTWTRQVCMRRADGPARVGGERVGTGIHGSMHSRSFLATASSLAHSAGVSIRLGGCIRRHSTDTVMDTDTTTITSARTITIGDPALIT